MIEDIAKAIFDTFCPGIRYLDNDKEIYQEAAKAVMVAMLPHIKGAMEYHGLQGAMNKQIIKRIEDQLK